MRWPWSKNTYRPPHKLAPWILVLCLLGAGVSLNLLGKAMELKIDLFIYIGSIILIAHSIAKLLNRHKRASHDQREPADHVQ